MLWVSFKFYQEVLLCWSGLGQPRHLCSLALNSKKQNGSNYVASTRQKSNNGPEYFFMETTVITFEIIWHFMSCCYSVLSWVNILSDYKRHCEKKGLCLTSSNQTYLLYEAIYSPLIVVQIKGSFLKRFKKQKRQSLLSARFMPLFNFSQHTVTSC